MNVAYTIGNKKKPKMETMHCHTMDRMVLFTFDFTFYYIMRAALELPLYQFKLHYIMTWLTADSWIF